MSNTHVAPLPSLRSTLQKYGMQNLLNDNLSISSIPSTPISRQPQSVHQLHQDISAPQVYRVEATEQQDSESARGKRKRPQCTVPDCPRKARKNKLCFIHGGRSDCKFPGCSKCSQKGGLCFFHGADLRCSTIACRNAKIINGVCRKHFNASNE